MMAVTENRAFKRSNAKREPGLTHLFLLEERLAAVVEDFNATLDDPARRVELHLEIIELRRKLGIRA